MGSTREIAERIAGQLRASGLDAIAVAAGDHPDASGWDAFVVGAGVYAGHWHPDAVDFVRDNRDLIADRPVWLFSSGPVGQAAVDNEPVEPKEIAALRRLVHPRDHRIFAGAFDRANVDRAGLGPATKFIASRFIPEGDFRDWGEIEAWAAGIARELRGTRAGDQPRGSMTPSSSRERLRSAGSR
jgi:menaquinone-dependent protoporphyrinogen oxidase